MASKPKCTSSTNQLNSTKSTHIKEPIMTTPTTPLRIHNKDTSMEGHRALFREIEIPRIIIIIM